MNIGSLIKGLKLLIFATLVTTFATSSVLAADGEALFRANCANCHNPIEKGSGPALKGWKERQPGGDWLYKWVANPAAILDSGDEYAKKLQAEYKIVMQAFPKLSKEEIDAIMAYVDAYEPPAKTTAAGGSGEGQDTNWLMYGLITFVLAVLGFILLQVNQNLNKLTAEKAGLKIPEPVPFYRNKAYILLFSLLALGSLGWVTMDSLINMGRSKNYQPEQPIYYSHKVHAGTNQISCLYCHASAQDGKHSNIPSVNTCMNCHISIKEYKGEQMLREDGSKVNGTAEIQKLYDYAGWDPAQQKYTKPGKPIPWIKIHNLPDHVYFNHSQHVRVGKQNCQTCHGNIQEMGEVKQYSDLSMGWCINCHRETKVDFNYNDKQGNKYYSIYEKYHQALRDSVEVTDGHGKILLDDAGKAKKKANPHKMDSVSVEDIGGTECQKCHY